MCLCEKLYFGYCNLFIRNDLLERYLLEMIKTLVGHLQFMVGQKHNMVGHIILPQISPIGQNVRWDFCLVGQFCIWLDIARCWPIILRPVGICLPYGKMCFQPHQWKVFFFRDQITQILLFSGMLVRERSQITFKNETFLKKFCGMCLPYLKIYFQLRLWFFFFRAQMTQLFLFSGMPIW